MTEIPPDFIDRVISDYLGVLIGSAVTVAGGIIATVIVTTIPWIREDRQEKGLRAKRAEYLAVRIIHILDRISFECFANVDHRNNIKEGKIILIPGKNVYSDPPGKHLYLPSIPEFPDDVDWKSIDSKLMHRIFNLQNYIWMFIDETKKVEGQFIMELKSYFHLYETRWLGYSRIGLSIAEIVSELIEKCIISDKEQIKVGALKHKQLFSSIIEEISESREGDPGLEERVSQEILEAMIKHNQAVESGPTTEKDGGK